MTTTTTEPHPRSKPSSGLDAWNRDVAARLEALRDLPHSREEAMDARRRRESLSRTQELVEHLVAQGLGKSRRPTAVLVHRSEWVRKSLTKQLATAGVTVVGEAEDGAQGLAYVVVAQPTLVILEDHLSWTTSVELVSAARQFSPHSHLVVHAGDVALGRECVDAGANAVFSRQVGLPELSERCLALLQAA